MEFYRIDKEHRLLGAIIAKRFDFAEGDESDTFTLTLPFESNIDQRLDKGWYADVPGTEYGGRIIDVQSDQPIGEIAYIGRTWGGLLNDRIIEPSAGQSHYRIQGEAHAAIANLIQHIGLGELFEVEIAYSEFTLDHSVRYEPAFDAIREALWRVGARLRKVYDYAKKRVKLSVVPVNTASDRAYSSTSDSVCITDYTPYNHLVCLGIGELEERIVLHLYADAQGNVSKTQTLFGLEERAMKYDYSAADADTLESEGTRALKELQVFTTVDATVNDDAEDLYALDDQIRSFDSVHNRFVSARIVKKIAQMDDEGHLAIDYETSAILE